MDTQKIKAVLSAVKHKSLSKAAEELSYTPSAFSHIADSLENELGVKLLNRTYAGVEFSDEGRLLFDKLQAVVNAEKELFEEAERIIGKQEKHLRIGTYSSASVHILPELLKDFKKIHPQVKISINVGDTLKNWLEDDVADIVLAVEDCALNKEWFPIFEDDFVAVVPQCELADRKSIECQELYNYAFIKTNDHYANDALNLEKFKEIINVESADDMSVISMVREGIGVAILPKLVLKNQTNGVNILNIKPRISRTLGFAYKKDNFASAKMIFVDYLKNRF